MLATKIDLSRYQAMENQTYYRTRGKVVNVVGLTIESAGPKAKMGDICMIYPKSKDDASALKGYGRAMMGEVVGFRNGRVLLMPYENVSGIGAGSVVTRSIPDNSFAAGVPCKVIRAITETDSLANHPEILGDCAVIPSENH